MMAIVCLEESVMMVIRLMTQTLEVAKVYSPCTAY